MIDALFGVVDANYELVTLVVHQLGELARSTPHVQDDGPAARNILGDYIPDACVVLDSVEAAFISSQISAGTNKTYSL